MDGPTWQSLVEHLQPYVVRISTPHGRGTGFLFAYTEDRGICGVATAAHVVTSSHAWEEPIRIEHLQSGKTQFLRAPERAIMIDPPSDAAAVVFSAPDLGFPDSILDLGPQDRYLKVGVEIGWIGYPHISPRSLCFFNGHISSYSSQEDAYLVDGVAINGVSGGPAFLPDYEGNPLIVGAVSAYISNVQPYATLPGLCKIAGVQQFRRMIDAFHTLEDAKEKETAPEDVEVSEEQEGHSAAYR